MERFLERLSLSPYQDKLILKGGVLVSSMLGLEMRSTMDVDVTVKNLSLSVDDVRKMVTDIVSVAIDDGMSFKIESVVTIMDEAEYPGVRVMLEVTLERMRTPLKIDFSTGDVITPQEIIYSLPLLFEDRAISLMAYNLETVLAEKLEALFSRGTANTRMRDFYDIFVLDVAYGTSIGPTILRGALIATSEKRGSLALIDDALLVLSEVERSSEMAALWKSYQDKFDYAADIEWNNVMKSIRRLSGVLSA
jgi:predicted nucleotidyltransferase component of viral defense system